MTYFQAIILGLVQGLTEFLPISSSGHLILVPYFLKWDTPGLAFDVALHWGTLLGVLIYFRGDLRGLVGGSFRWLQGSRTPQDKLPWFIILGTIPAGLMGLALKDLAENVFRSPWIVAGTLFFVGLLIWIAEKSAKKDKDLTHLTWKTALIIGAAQGIALIPGVSRSGITICAALFLSFTRVSSVRFSFLLSIPIILAAGLLNVSYFLKGLSNPIFVSGVLSAALSGYAAVSFLLHFVKTNSFKPFVVYRVLLSFIIIGVLLAQ